MIVVDIPIPKREKIPPMAEGSMRAPGRNSATLALWIVEKLLRISTLDHPRIADPMCSVGQMWQWALKKYEDLVVYGCELQADRAALANANGLEAIQGEAKTWVPPGPVAAVIFSPIYPDCDHDSGATEKQKEMVEKKGLYAGQKITGTVNLLPVFLHIASWRGKSPVIVISRNSIEKQVEVDRTSEIEASMYFAGLGPIRRYRRPLAPSFHQQGKVKRNSKHRVVRWEWVLMAGGGE